MSKERAAKAERILERQLIRRYPHLNDNAVQFLLDEGKSKVEWQDHVVGGLSLDVTSLVHSIAISETGQLILGEAEEDGAGGSDDELAELQKMGRAERMTAARRLGLF